MYVWGGDTINDPNYFETPNLNIHYESVENPFPDASENAARDEIHRDEFFKPIDPPADYWDDHEDLSQDEDDIVDDEQPMFQVTRSSELIKYNPEMKTWEKFAGPNFCHRVLHDPEIGE